MRYGNSLKTSSARLIEVTDLRQRYPLIQQTFSKFLRRIVNQVFVEAKSAPTFQPEGSTTVSEDSVAISGNLPKKKIPQATQHAAAHFLSISKRDSTAGDTSDPNAQNMSTSIDESFPKPLDLTGPGLVDDHDTDGYHGDGNKVTFIPPDISSALLPANTPPAANIIAQEDSQSAKIDHAGFEDGAPSLPRIISADLKVVDRSPAPTLSQIRSQSAPPDNPIIPATRQQARPSILLSHESKNANLFAAGYNHKMFAEAAKRMGDEELEESFDFKAYTGENLESGSKAMVDIVQELTFSKSTTVSVKEGAKDNRKLVDRDEMMQDAEDQGNIQSTPKTTAETTSAPSILEIAAESINKDLSVEEELAAGDEVMKDIVASDNDVGNKISTQNLDVADSRSSAVKSSIEQEALEGAELTDEDVEMGDLEEVDQI
ncbi:hypothetical protein BKA65DRAFT_471863 [Rhexocercosporidium sp. MPI-PUGE-AT-0058]|nr:hypothetical protein BKA65DRAFT_471863 [Rhexocercosporidium sp. MPI-PUGE-AT-0058]